MDLKELRTSKGRSQHEIGLSQVYVSKIETGKVEPAARAVATIAEALGVATEVVFAACRESYRRAHAAHSTDGVQA